MLSYHGFHKDTVGKLASGGSKRRQNFKEADPARALSIAPEENAARFLYVALSGLAGIAARLQQPVRAARLFGAVEKMIETISGPPDQIERCEFAKDITIVRDSLTPGALSQAWLEGRSMEVEQAVGEGRAIVEELDACYFHGNGEGTSSHRNN